jgi:ribosomal protein L22
MRPDEDPTVEESTADEAASATPTAEQPPAEGRSSSGASDAASSEASAPAEKKPRVRRPRKAAAKAEAVAETSDLEEKPAAAPKERRVEPVGRRPVVRAHAKYVRTSARKARLVCDHIRGKSVPEARAILQFAPRAVARDWAKLLDSAVANAENNHELLADDLRIKEVYADEGPTLKRFRPRAMGRATQIHKRTSHLTITLTPKE